MAGVLFEQGKTVNTAWEPDNEMLGVFWTRKENPTVVLEALAFAIGLSTFRDRLEGTMVRVWIDNAGGKG